MVPISFGQPQTKIYQLIISQSFNEQFQLEFSGMLTKHFPKVFYLSFMIDPVNHHSTHFIDSSLLSRRSARCLLSQLSFNTVGFRCLFSIRSRRFVLSAPCSFLGFVRAPHDCPFAILIFVAFILAVLDYSTFLRFSRLFHF